MTSAPTGKSGHSRGMLRKRFLKGLTLPDAGAAQRHYRQLRKLAHRAGQRPRLPFFPWGTSATPAKELACL